MKFGISIQRLTGAVLALGLGAASLAAQQPEAPVTAPPIPNVQAPAASQAGLSTSDTAQPVDPALTIRNQKTLESFEPAANEEYTLGSGDEITLDFPGRPELSTDNKQVIGPDGRITVKLGGAIFVAGLTRSQAEKAIIDALSKYYTDLAVTVRVDKYASNKVRVIGYVQHPGEQLFESTPTLLDAIGKAGLISPMVTNGTTGTASNIGPGVPEICTVYRGNSQAVQVQLREMLMTGNALADMRLRRGDIVYVPEPKQQFVSVLGQVGHPGTVQLTKDSTLTSVLAEAGCCGPTGGYNATIHIIQPSTGRDFKVKYNEVMTIAGQQEYTLHSGDVILVPTSGFNKVTDVIQKVSSVATVISIAALVGLH
jgi:polysaccharide export outer membrane protein